MSANINYDFPTAYNDILARIEKVNPVKYAKSRNFITGDVTYLSPYISRGVISVKQVMQHIMSRGHSLYEIEKFVQELCWREYWQRIWQSKGNEIFTDLKQTQLDVTNRGIALSIIEAKTRIDAIDKFILQMYEDGYMHNHVRMYVASIACNISKSHWSLPAEWMYYHLLDGDLASNHISWQWVAGSASSKKYYADQNNISKYTGSNQQKSFLQNSYEQIAEMPVPDVLKEIAHPEFKTVFPNFEPITIDETKNICVYNSYNLDPIWRANEDCNRILLLEPSHFNKYPVSENVLHFIIELSKNISDIKVFVGEFSELKSKLNPSQQCFYKEHPTTLHYKGTCDSRDWIAPDVTGYFNSFFSFWKKVEKSIKQNYK
jgi:deoxyribodipyrimidine photo-lyase